MNYNIETDNRFGTQFNKLNCSSSDTISFLPENFYEAESPQDFIYPDSTTDLIKLFRINEISSELVDNTHSRYRTRKDADWLGPTILISASMLAENNALITLALNVLSNHVIELFKGSFGRRAAKFEVIVETDKNMVYKRISYKGDPEGIKELAKIIKSL